MKNVSICENVDLHIHPSVQFKDVTVRIELLKTFDRKDLCGMFMLDYLLSDTCMAYPTKDEAQRISDELYGAAFSGRTTSRGCGQIYEFTCTCIDGMYVRKTDLFEQQLAFMSEFIFHPLAANGRFDDALFEECRKKLIVLRGLYTDQPGEYALEQASIAYGGFYGSKGMPEIEEIQAIKNEEVYQIYRNILDRSAVDIMILGNVDEQQCTQLVKKYFRFPPRQAERSILYRSHRDGFVEKQDHRDLTQSSLVMIYDSGVNYIDEITPAFMLGNGILGGLPTSFLFQEIREKKGLCYSICSENEPYDAVLVISAEVECGAENETEELIKAQVRRLQNGEFDQELLNTTCSMYCDSWRSSRDGVRSLIWDDYRSILLHREDTVEQHIDAFMKVTREDIIEAWKNVELKVSYRLSPEESENE